MENNKLQALKIVDCNSRVEFGSFYSPQTRRYNAFFCGQRTWPFNLSSMLINFISTASYRLCKCPYLMKYLLYEQLSYTSRTGKSTGM